jgi:hypothetical protein
MTNIESTRFTALKNIVNNVENIYDEGQKWGFEEGLLPFLAKISENVFILLGGDPSNNDEETETVGQPHIRLYS